MDIAQRVARTVAQLGITRAYGLPGEDHMALLDALADAGISYRTAYNESSAVIMAATDAQLTGRPGLVVLSLAPGVSNGMNGILHAYLEGLPVLVLAGQHPAGKLPFVVRQGFDTEQMVRPAAKWTTRVPADSDPAELLCKAVDIALDARQGPVYVELPDEVAVAPAPVSDRGDRAAALLAAELDEADRRRPVLTPAASTLDELAARLATAEHPALIVGGRGAPVSSEVLARFSETCRVPVFTTTGQKGALDSRSPYFAGTLLNGNLEARLLERADLILTVDFEAYDVYNKPWRYTCPTVSISRRPLLEWFQPFDLRVVADPDACLTALTERIGGEGPSRFTPKDITGYRDDLRATLLDTAPEGLSVARAVDAVLRGCDRETVVLADAGFSKPLLALLSDTHARGRFLASSALSTMGFSIPAGIAAAHASGGRVVAFMGDGSLLMRATEVAAAQGAPVPPVFVAVVDRSLSQIEIKQARRGLRTVGVGLPEISCRALGEALGIRGRDAHSVEEIETAVASAWDEPTPLLLGVHVDPSTSQPIYDLLRG
ncbi:thiamine pyrophosphate-binding protein [Streptomyces sp. NBRC 109706]|uniref:thiamine pyrophosphate-binding protein n=1 Tax=Streptomyces sp. NBRC 109706 TaxID=1550035 RepID=UPI0007813EF8|nr:thiamine pyrophosphate-binding protein [Streptomyces sp. NBRC 109706]